MRVLSLFDGMACGMIAFKVAGIPIDSYDAYEIDKFAVQVATHNFPEIKEHGDVFQADFTEYEGVDYVIGGSPCTYWSIAQSPDKRETTASGIGWELFQQYVRAINEAKPKYFIYENNKSMAKAIYDSISATFGFEPIMINSALVSAQNRERYYWVGKRNEYGKYDKVRIEQPKDREIMLKDILITGESLCQSNREKSTAVMAHYHKEQAENTFLDREKPVIVAEPLNTQNGKSQTIKAQYQNTAVSNICCYKSTYGASGVAEPVCERIPKYGKDDKSRPVIASYSNKGDSEGCLKGDAFPDNPNKQVNDYVAEPISEKAFCMVGDRDNRKAGTSDKTYCLCAAPTSDMTSRVIKRVGGLYEQVTRRGIYDENGIAPTLTASMGMGGGHIPMVASSEPIKCFNFTHKDGSQTSGKGYRVYDENGKAVTLCAEGGGMGAKSGLYAISTDGKRRKIYKIKDGVITIKGKQYPIKLKDGYYIIRKLTVKECMRLQTVPEWYDFSSVSDSQAYKKLGNGWTIEVIAHLIRATQEGKTEAKQLTFWEV